MASQARLKVILGTMLWGQPDMFEAVTISEPQDITAILDSFQAYGHTDVDTARIYGAGSAEGCLADAKWKERKLTVATKLYPTKGKPMAHLGTVYSFSPADLRRGLIDSLKALDTPKLDIWFLYAPDRTIPLEESLAQVNLLHREGLFDRLGISNFMSWEVARVCELCGRNGWVKPSVYQGLYNALHRAIEPELVPCLRHYKIPLWVGQPLAGGFLTSRYNREYPESAHPRRSRFDPKTKHGMHHRSRYWNDTYFDALDVIRESVRKYGLTEAECGLRWLSYHSIVKAELGDGVMVGSSTLQQLEENLQNLEKGPLPEEVVKALDAAWIKVKPIAPRYNH